MSYGYNLRNRNGGKSSGHQGDSTFMGKSGGRVRCGMPSSRHLHDPIIRRKGRSAFVSQYGRYVKHKHRASFFDELRKMLRDEQKDQRQVAEVKTDVKVKQVETKTKPTFFNRIKAFLNRKVF